MDIQMDGNENSIRIKGEVANANRLGSGIEFKKVNTNLSEKLSNLLYRIR